MLKSHEEMFYVLPPLREPTDFPGGDKALRQHLIVAGLTHNPHAINTVCGQWHCIHIGAWRMQSSPRPIAPCIREEDFYCDQRRHLRLQLQFAAAADAIYALGATLDVLMSALKAPGEAERPAITAALEASEQNADVLGGKWLTTRCTVDPVESSCDWGLVARLRRILPRGLQRRGLEGLEIALTRPGMGHNGMGETEPGVVHPVRLNAGSNAHPGLIEDLLEHFDDVRCERRCVQ